METVNLGHLTPERLPPGPESPGPAILGPEKLRSESPCPVKLGLEALEPTGGPTAVLASEQRQ